MLATVDCAGVFLCGGRKAVLIHTRVLSVIIDVGGVVHVGGCNGATV